MNIKEILEKNGYTGTIVTVLPLEFHATLAWPISEEDKQRATSQARRFLSEREPVEIQTEVPRSFSLSVSYVDTTGNLKTKLVQKFAAASYSNDIRQFLRAGAALDQLGELALAKGIKPESIAFVLVRLGKSDPVIVDWEYDQQQIAA